MTGCRRWVGDLLPGNLAQTEPQPMGSKAEAGVPAKRSVGFAKDKRADEAGTPLRVGIRGSFSRALRGGAISRRFLGTVSTPEEVVTQLAMAVTKFPDRHLGERWLDTRWKAEDVRWLPKLPSANEETLTWVERDTPQSGLEIRSLLCSKLDPRRFALCW